MKFKRVLYFGFVRPLLSKAKEAVPVSSKLASFKHQIAIFFLYSFSSGISTLNHSPQFISLKFPISIFITRLQQPF